MMSTAGVIDLSVWQVGLAAVLVGVVIQEDRESRRAIAYENRPF